MQIHRYKIKETKDTVISHSLQELTKQARAKMQTNHEIIHQA